jgi:hypothetical protein
MGTQHTLEEVGSRLPPTRERTGSLEHRPPSGKLRSSPDQQMPWRSPRFPRLAASRLGTLALCVVAIGVATLAGCGESAPPPSGQPTFYQDLAQTDAAVDAAVAQSMISGYRSNNGLGPVVVDSDLMRLAGEQARAMAARDKMDHDVGHPSDDDEAAVDRAPVSRAHAQGRRRRQRCGRERRRRLSHAR